MEDGEGPRIKGGGRTKGGEGDSETEGDTVSRTGGTSGPTGTNALVFLTLVIGEKAINISQMVFIVINSEEKVSGVMGPHHLSVCVCVGTTVCVVCACLMLECACFSLSLSLYLSVCVCVSECLMWDCAGECVCATVPWAVLENKLSSASLPFCFQPVLWDVTSENRMLR